MPVTNALKRLMQKTRSLSYCIGLVMVCAVFVYGLIRYPDLPIRECPSGYCGRHGCFILGLACLTAFVWLRHDRYAISVSLMLVAVTSTFGWRCLRHWREE